MRGFCAVEQDNKERFLPCPQSRWPPAKTSQQKCIFKNRSKECVLAVSHGEKFHRKDSLLPRPKWLESPKTNKSRSQHLERWSLEFRAFDFDIVHLPGSINLNADALSRRPIAVVGVTSPVNEEEIAAAQNSDATLSPIYDLVKKKLNPPHTRMWSQFPWKRYKQI